MIFLEQVKEILPQMVNNLGINKNYKTQLAIFNWEKIVGKDIAAQSSPLSVEYNVLFISVNNSVWCHHLSMMKADIIFKVNQFVGEPLIKDIRFRTEYFKKKTNDEQQEIEEVNIARELRKVRLDANEVNTAKQIVENVVEEKLQDKIAKIYQKHLAFNKLKKAKQWHKCEKCDTLCPKESQYCSVCKIELKKEKHAAIRKILLEVPWVTYAEVNSYVACTADEYIDAKITLIRIFASNLNLDKGEDNTIDMNLMTLTMLFTGAKHDEVNEKLINKTIAKFRRKY